MGVDSDKNLINCFTDNQYCPSRPLAPKESDKSYLFSTFLLRIEMRRAESSWGYFYVERVSEDNSPHGVSTAFHFKNIFAS